MRLNDSFRLVQPEIAGQALLIVAFIAFVFRIYL